MTSSEEKKKPKRQRRSSISWRLQIVPRVCRDTQDRAEPVDKEKTVLLFNKMARQFTMEERVWLAMEYHRRRIAYRRQGFFAQLLIDFRINFPNAVRSPSLPTIINIHRGFQRTGTVLNRNSLKSPGPSHSGRRKTVSTPANAAAVRALCAHDADKEMDLPHLPVSSCRRNVLGISKSSFNRLVQQEKLHPYKILKSHKLEAQDYPRRLQMCHYLVNLTPQDLASFCFSDEAQFDLDGTVNSQNVRRYVPRKGTLPAGQRQGRPAHFRQQKTNFPQKVMVFLGVKGDGSLFGYTKIQGSLNSPGYHALLQHRALPDLRQGNGGTLDGLHWMQDGAPPHASDLNIQYLARQFGGRLLARRSEPYGGRDWAARSPDLNPLDYGF